VRPVIGVDIGSTWTKAALFDLDAAAPRLVRRAATPTTQEDLSVGVERLARELLALDAGAAILPALAKAPLQACSSARGGLSIAAIGIVPDLTARVARLAAASAGGRIAAHHSYRLGSEQVAAIERENPDIVLFCGGTDGGNEGFVRANAHALAESPLPARIVYAGNAAMRDEVRTILAGKPLTVVANAMPEVGVLDIEPARQAIRRIYLDTIVEGRGLARVQEMAASPIRPTPLAVLELLEELASAGTQTWSDTLVVDMGGATTDVYSRTSAFHGEQGWVLRGIREPDLTRTVEGDLGMRVSALSAWQTGSAYAASRLGGRTTAAHAWIQRVCRQPDTLPSTEEESGFDDLLAETCLYHALLRHAGTAEETWTAAGKVRVQKGKDLRAVRRIVASGGFLAGAGTTAPLVRALASARAHRDERTGSTSLLPEDPAIIPDGSYVITLLGAIAAAHPEAACAIAAAAMGPRSTQAESSREGHAHAQQAS
jgi:uncharacterized protein (TIGR01319 family)